MSATDQFAERLRQAFEAKQGRERRDRRRYSQSTLAEAIGVDRNTLQGWLNRGARPREAGLLSALAHELEVTVEWLAGTEEDGRGGGPTDGEAATMLPTVMKGLPYEVRVWLQHELLDYAKAGVTDRELRAARDLYERPEVFTFYAGGAPQARTEDEVLLGMRAMSAVVRGTLRRRGYKLAADTPF